MDLLKPATRKRAWVALMIIFACATAASLSALPFGTPTLAGVLAFVAASAVAEALSVYYRRRDDRWAWTAATVVVIPAYVTDPGWWVILATPVLFISYLARHYTAGQALLRALARDAATVTGALVAYTVATAAHTGDGFGTAALAALAGLVARMGINMVTHYPMTGQRSQSTVGARDGVITEVLLAYLSLAIVWSWQQEEDLALIVVVPAVVCLLGGLFHVDRMLLRMRLFEAVAAGQAESRRSALDMAWTIGHAVDRFSGDSTVGIAVLGSRAKYYEIVEGIPRLRTRGGPVWDMEWVSLMRSSSNPLVSRFIGHGGHEYLFRLSDGPDSTIMYRVLTEDRASFRYRMPISTLRQFVVAARRWAEPALRTDGDLFSAASEASNHLLSLMSQRGKERPVREILVELHRLEELVAMSLAGTVASDINDTRDHASRVPLGVWPGAQG